MTRRPPVRRALALSAVGLLSLGALAACGDDSGDKVDTTTTVAPESVKVPLSQVLSGLPEVVDHGNAAAAAGNTGDYTTAKSEYQAMKDGWFAIEGTIKDLDADAYVDLETAQGLIKDGADHQNSERIQQGADDQSDAAQAFLDAHRDDAATTDGGATTTVAGGATTTTLGGAGDSYATDQGASNSNG